MAWSVFAGIALLQAVVNALTELEERELAGRPVDPWEPWTWELTSIAAWIVIAPAMFLAALRLRPPRFNVFQALAAHLAASLAVSICHVALMQAQRMFFYWLAGDEYGETIVGTFIYEYRKDLVTYVLVILFFMLFERVIRPGPASIHPATSEPAPIEVRDGNRILWLKPDDIEWVQAAGNYVELNGAFGSVLHRQSLAALQQALAPHGFIRVQRSRAVRRAAVIEIETRPSGDFELILASGTRIGGSRRYRDNLSCSRQRPAGSANPAK